MLENVTMGNQQLRVRMEIVFGIGVTPEGDVFGKGGKLSPSDNGRGYLIVSSDVGTRAVHKLVALAYVPNPKNLPEVNHKDGNKRHNHYSNLEWCTRGKNIAHAYENNLRSATGINNARCKTTEDEVHTICKHLESGKSSAECRDLGFNYNIVRAIKSRKNWKHISKDYTF
jgi:hypothetical protein